MTEKKTALDR